MTLGTERIKIGKVIAGQSDNYKVVFTGIQRQPVGSGATATNANSTPRVVIGKSLDECLGSGSLHILPGKRTSCDHIVVFDNAIVEHVELCDPRPRQSHGGDSSPRFEADHKNARPAETSNGTSCIIRPLTEKTVRAARRSSACFSAGRHVFRDPV
jgi:hypothetical protein